MEQLIALASEVKKYRWFLVEMKGILADDQAMFNVMHQKDIEDIQKTAAALQGAESDLRKATVAAYLADPAHNKNVLPGVVAIRDNTVIGYHPEKALAWAEKRGVALLLDTKKYEALVRIGLAPGTVLVEPQATIARDIKLPQVSEKP